MNFAQKKVLTIATGLFSIGFTIVSLSTATIAWFAQNNRVSATGMNIRCIDPSQPITLSYEVLKWDEDNKVGISYGQDSSKIVLPQYDRFISKQNDYANVILRLQADFSADYELENYQYIKFDIDCSANLFKSGTSYIDDQSSNVIQFKSAVSSYTVKDAANATTVTGTITDTSANSKYTTATSYFEALPLSTVFVTPNDSSSTKLSDKTVTIVPNIPTRTAKIEQVVMYMELSYNFVLVDNYIDNRSTTISTDFGDGSVVSLTGDVNAMVFSVVDTMPTLDSLVLNSNDYSLSVIETDSDSIAVSGTPSGNVTWRAAENTGSVSLSNKSNAGVTVTGTSGGSAVVSGTTGQASAQTKIDVQLANAKYVLLDPTTINGTIGDNANTITATAYNIQGTIHYSWSSNNTSIVTLTSSDTSSITLSLVGGGSTTVTCQATGSNGSASASCIINVASQTVTLDPSNIVVSLGSSNGLITATANNFTDTPTFAWAISSVTPSGAVTLVGISGASTGVRYVACGTAVITCTATYGTETATATCNVRVKDLTLDPTSLTYAPSSSTTYTVTATPGGLGDNVTYGWAIENESTSGVVAIQSGSNSATVTVKLPIAGTASLTCTATGADSVTASATCSVTVGGLVLTSSKGTNPLYVNRAETNVTVTANLLGLSGTPSFVVNSGSSVTLGTQSSNTIGLDFAASGSSEITASLTYNGTTYTDTIMVYVCDISLSPDSLSAQIGSGTRTITATPSGLTGTVSYNWSLSNVTNSCVTITSSGDTCTVNISSSNAGTATVTCYATDTNNTTQIVNCQVTITGATAFTKVTTALSDWSGTYLIVYESESMIFDGSLTTLDAANNYQSVTITSSSISYADGSAYSFTIAASGSSYSIQSVSGYYIGRTADSNGLDSDTSTVYTNTISLDSGNANIVSSGGAYLRFNTTSGQDRFRYYKSSSYSAQKAIALYKLG